MKPYLELRTLPLPPSSTPRQSTRNFGVAPALAFTCLALAACSAIAQQPSPIPNWTPQQAGTTAGQYASDPQQYGGAPQQQYGQQYPESQYDPSQDSSAPPYQPAMALNADRLEQLVAPVALYPDNLVSIVLAASTYPAQVSAADQWLHMQGGVSPEQIAAGANAQTAWDPSVKALTAFPQVLDQLAQNLQWTTDLGNAYYNQPQDVMQSIQVMRGRARSAGYLQDTPQQEVIEEQGNIEIAPPTPDVVYVPQYDPWGVYGAPVDPYPGFNITGFFGDALFQFGPGIAMQAFAATPFGWLGWGLDWFAHAIFFNHDLWCTRSYSVHDWGFAHGGARYWGRHGDMARFRDRGWRDRGWGHEGFRSGLDRRGGNWGNGGGRGGNWGNRDGRGGDWGNGGRGGNWNNGGGRPIPRTPDLARNGGNNAFRGAYERGNNWGRGNNPYGGYGQSGRGGYAYGPQQGWQSYNRAPQSIGRPQPYRGGNAYGFYGNNSPGYTPRPGFGGGYTQPYRSPGYNSYNYGPGNRASRGYGGYGGPSIGRAPSGGGWSQPSHSFNYGGGGYRAPKAPSFSGHGWGGGGGGGFKAPHFSGGGGGGGHFGGGHSGGGGHFSGGGGHSGGRHH